MPELRLKIPSYQTLSAFEKNHAGREGERDMWISIAKLDMASSQNNSVLVTRPATMRFNIRGANGVDTGPTDQAYAQLLSNQYDALEVQFPLLHELRECAKLSGVAAWLHSRKRDVRLPIAAGASWDAPSRIAGIMNMYLYQAAGNKCIETVVI